MGRARKAGLPGLSYDAFGRSIGRRLFVRGVRGSVRLMLQPVDFLRYFEFDYVDRFARKARGPVLDVASPALFSLYQAARNPAIELQMVNPDRCDLEWTELAARRLRLKLETENAGVESIASIKQRFGAIWSISVLEHIAGDLNDSDAVRILYDALEPGGALILTVMTDRRYRNEYLNNDIYNLGQAREERGIFFQRFYDEEALHRRLIGAVPEAELADLSWYGEVKPGIYDAYIERARRSFDYRWAVNEPLEAACGYARFDDFSHMPGIGVSAFRLIKPG
ncbi:MAG: hypothetical protein DRP71_08820 [Verrucomicrobia bacterium]|nr:MAG: hypothetical protein DRP71_08820 [Verrucomicrobiota bacterium]